MRILGLLLLSLSCQETRVRPDATTRVDSGQDGGVIGDSGAKTDAGSVDGGVTPSGVCRDRPCLTGVTTLGEWSFVSGPARGATRCDLTREAIFVVPKQTGAEIEEPLFVDLKRHNSLYDFLKEHMASELPGLDPQTYFDKFERDDTAEYWTGNIFERDGGGFAFALQSTQYFAEPPNQQVLESIHTLLTRSFTLPLHYAPQKREPIRQARAFTNPSFEVLLPEPCAGEACADPSKFCVVIPASTEICGTFAENRPIEGELAAKLKIDLVPGSYELPDQVGTTPMTLFAGGLYGPDQVPVTFPTAGRLEVTDFSGTLYYAYVQDAVAGPDTLQLRWDFQNQDPGNQLILREPALSDSISFYGSINNSMTFPDGQIVGSGCGAFGLSLYFAEGTTSTGDTFRLEYRHELPFAGSGPLQLTGAVVMFGGQVARVTDYFNLTYAGVHHNWDNQFVVLFDSPLTYMGHEIFGLWVDEADYRCCPVDGVYTLDANHQQLDTLDISSYVRSPAFF